MVYCSACGENNDEESMFCINCGNQLGTQQQTNENQSQETNQYDQRNAPMQKPIRKRRWGFLRMRLGIWIIFGIFYYLSRT